MAGLNYGGAASGAGAGAIAGSAFGPWGTAIGGVAGGAAGLFSGNPDAEKKFQNLTPEQQQFLSTFIGDLQQSRGGYNKALNQTEQFLDPNSQAYRDFEDPYIREFEQQTVPGLAEKFAGYGAESGALSSSGFGQALGSAGANLKSTLANLKAQMMRTAAQDLFGQYNQQSATALGTNSFTNAYQPGTKGFGANALEGIAGGFGQAAGQNAYGKAQNYFGGGQQNTPPVSTNQVNLTGVK